MMVYLCADSGMFGVFLGWPTSTILTFRSNFFNIGLDLCIIFILSFLLISIMIIILGDINVYILSPLSKLTLYFEFRRRYLLNQSQT